VKKLRLTKAFVNGLIESQIVALLYKFLYIQIKTIREGFPQFKCEKRAMPRFVKIRLLDMPLSLVISCCQQCHDNLRSGEA